MVAHVDASSSSSTWPVKDTVSAPSRQQKTTLRTLSDLLDLAESLLDQARLAVNEHRMSVARDLLQRCQQASNDVSLTHETVRLSRLRFGMRLVLAWIVFEDSGLSKAVDSLLDLRAEVEASGFRDLAALSDMQRGALLGRSGDLTGALLSLQQAEEQREWLTDVEQARLLINRGALSFQIGDPRDASRDSAEAARLAAGSETPSLRFMAIHNQGYAEFLLGNFPGALSLMEHADAMDVDVDRGIARLDQARVMLEAGLIDEAHQVLIDTLEQTSAASSEHDLGEIELELARCEILMGDSASALARAATARRRFHRRKEPGWRRAALIVELETRDTLSAHARERLASALARAAAAEGDEAIRQRAVLVHAEALIDQGLPDQARATLAQAPALTRSPHVATRLHTRHVSARISDGSGRPDLAARMLKRAADDLGAAGRQSAGLDLRTALTVHGADLVSLDLDLALRHGSAARVLSRTELWRDVVRALPPVRASEDPARAVAITRLRRSREDLRTAPPSAPQAALRAEVTRAERAVRELDWTTQVQSHQVAEAEGPLPARDIRLAVRRAGVAMLATFTLADSWHAVLVRPDGALSMHRFGGVPEITERIRATQADLRVVARVLPSNPLYRVVRASLTQRLIELDDVLLAPLRSEGLSQTGLVIVPTPVLGQVPWAMLPSRRGRATTVARSATMWVRRHTELVAAPKVWAGAGPDLPLADREIASVVSTWGEGTAVPALESTTQGLLSAFEGSDLVHVAAHGEHHSQNPLFSNLRLSDGSLFAHEMEGRRLRASHVVLSACESGRTSMRRGEEALGLTASLLTLGVASVVAAASPVPDEIAHDVMGDYHRNLAVGMDSATALARATAEGDVLGAAFTCFGSPWRHPSSVDDS